jgi:predicted Zn-dependent protease
MPGGKIAVNRGLLTELNSEAELAAVLGHEVTHAAARHGAKGMQRGIILQGALIATAVVSSQKSEYASALVGAAQVAAGLISTKYGRDAERQSDKYGTRWLAKAGYDPVAAVELQETFVRLSEGRKSNWLAGLFSSHPPSAERVANNKRLVAELRESGAVQPDAELGRQRYAQAMQFLNSRKTAFAAQDKARKALAEDDLGTALIAINAALKLEPREASFHGVRGDIRYKQKRWKDAVINYDRAVERDANYYHYYLGRGMATTRYRDRRVAKADLERSLKLLPTATAFNELGKIAEDEGNSDLALKYYAAAGESSSNEGTAARSRYAALDLPRNPARYVKTRVTLDQTGAPVLLVANATQTALINIEVQVELGWSNGQAERLAKKIRALPAGGQVSIALPNRNLQLQRQASAAVAAQLAR